MFAAFRFVHQVLWFILAFMLIMLGLDWLDPEIGQGLHPWIAFPIAFLILMVVVRSVISDIRHEVHLHRMAKFHRQAKAEREHKLRKIQLGWK